LRSDGVTEKKVVLAFQRAKRWLQGSERAFEDGRWDDVVYSAQMAVEQAVKALLMKEGLIFRRVHDVADELHGLRSKMSLRGDVSADIDRILDTLVFLGDQRSLAGYGYESEVDVNFFIEIAPEAFQRAKNALDLLSAFIAEEK